MKWAYVYPLLLPNSKGKCYYPMLLLLTLCNIKKSRIQVETVEFKQISCDCGSEMYTNERIRKKHFMFISVKNWNPLKCPRELDKIFYTNKLKE